ncbi:NAD(P)H dehydrogenase (quinone) [Lysinibacillus sp. PLM2]|nr:NAD(P)H dehydrogenase (quinone) [Lysinibacillus sp. PLM2]
MNVLVIYTHPNHQSLCYSFLQKVIEGSEKNPKITELQVLDLYEEQFQPALQFNKQKRRRDMHLDAEMERYRKQISWADKVVFIYPIWWGRPPAMLLGYIDQVFAANFAYKFKNGLLPDGLLKGKSAVCISTMRGPTFYPRLLLHNAHQVLMKKGLFKFTGMKKVKFFEFGSMEKSGGNQSKKLEKVFQYFQKISR